MTAEISHTLSEHICELNSDVGRDFHGFLWPIASVLWIWLESKSALGRSVIFLTRSSDLELASSQPVYDESLVSITVCTISEASTGNGYYYCIYIDISLYILRRSTRQSPCTKLQTLPLITLIALVYMDKNCDASYLRSSG